MQEDKRCGEEAARTAVSMQGTAPRDAAQEELHREKGESQVSGQVI